jgi:SAM-dependent methyltransferase
MNDKSRLMRILLRLGFERLAWACRRLYCPVPKSALVLEVGSGGSPYFRSNILADAYEETRERYWTPFINDRPSVVARGESLPFKDKIFDFVIASHVVEHSADPEAFLMELQRVAKAGYIETPDAFMERLNPYWDHRAELTVRNDVLLVKKKQNWEIDPELNELYEARVKNLITRSTIPTNPFSFHCRFYWIDDIKFKILNPGVDSSWPAPIFSAHIIALPSVRARFGKLALAFFRKLLSQHSRNKKIKLSELMQCSRCKCQNMIDRPGYSLCTNCKLEIKTPFV